MTTQEAYEMMRIYLTRPGAVRAVNESDDCMYETHIRGEIHRCAVGCLLTPDSLDELSGEEFQRPLREFVGTIGHVLREFSVPELRSVDFQFLQEAQRLHDDEGSWIGGFFNVRRLDALADRYGLQVVKDEEPVAEPEPVLTLA